VKLHELKPAKGATHRRKRVGRGNSSGTGKTSGRGQKGQKSRNSAPGGHRAEGGQMPLQRRVPKWGGFTPINRVEFEVVNIGTLDDAFESGETVTAEALSGRRLVRKGRPVKVLARGELTKGLTVRANKFSKQAAEKIQAAGGTAEVI
jgi:large subunit ribosomal protein L15